MGLLNDNDWKDAKRIGWDRPMDAPHMASVEIMESWIGGESGGGDGICKSCDVGLHVPDSPVVNALAY